LQTCLKLYNPETKHIIIKISLALTKESMQVWSKINVKPTAFLDKELFTTNMHQDKESTLPFRSFCDAIWRESIKIS
jgi:hypothetical protein